MIANQIATRQLFNDYVVPNYGRYDVVFTRGKGSRVWDEEGKEYLDFGAGIAVSTIGHGHPRLVEAIAKQASQLIHTSNLYFTRPQGELARKLVEIVGEPGKVFFSNSGAEANEVAFKLCRKFGNECGSAQGRVGMITFERSFHGRTMAGISATAQEKVKKGFEPLLEGFTHLPFNDLNAVKSAITPQTSAILVEPVQGEGGIYPVNREFLAGLRSLCDEHDLLLMLDEIQCGLGRLGNWCGWKELVGADFIPDTVSWAKGIGGGFPLGATWIRKRRVQLRDGNEIDLCDLFQPGSHGTTFGGTPLACAAAMAVLATIDEQDLVGNARTLGVYARERLMAIPGVGAVRGIGLMLGIEIVQEFARITPSGKLPSQIVVTELMRNGLLSVPAGPTVIRWLPALNVSKAEVDEAIQILSTTLHDLLSR
jgi:acetylornithine aminotransferase/acetylornithine/N-succinyldiaminopimelate aminotransferase